MLRCLKDKQQQQLNFVALALLVTGVAACHAGDKTATVPAAPAVGSPSAVGVFFQENFDDANLAARGWYDNTNVAITTDHFGALGGSLLYHFLPGATTPVSGAAIRHKFGPSNSMYVSYYVKYSSNWVGSAHTYQPHEFYALSSMDGDWDGLSNDWMTLYIEHNYQNGGEPVMAMQDNKAINTLLGALPINLIALTEVEHARDLLSVAAVVQLEGARGPGSLPAESWGRIQGQLEPRRGVFPAEHDRQRHRPGRWRHAVLVQWRADHEPARHHVSHRRARVAANQSIRDRALYRRWVAS